MHKKISIIAASVITAMSAQATTANYGWEDDGAILGTFSADHLLHSQSAEQARTGNFSLKIEDPDTSDNSTTQSYVGWVNGLTDGDTVSVSLWVFDDSDDNPAGRIWGHYTDDASDVTSYAGSASGNSTFTTGGGWQQLQHTWTFDSNSGSRDGLMIEFRLYDSADFATGTVYLDDISIDSSAGTITLANGTIIEPDTSDDGDTGNPPDSLTCGDTFTAINSIQGNGETTPLADQAVEVEGIVTADFQSTLSGFYLQSASDEEDNDVSTSEGIFVFTGNSPLEVTFGNRIRIAATAEEFRDVTQLSSVSAMEVCADSGSVPEPKLLSLPFEALPESLEGMRVSFNALTVNEVFQLGRFGTVTLSNGRRPIPTQVAAPGEAALQQAEANALNQIVLDDGSNEQNPDVVPYPTGGLSAQNTLRVGDSITMTEGVMHYAFGDYRVHPTAEVTVAQTNPRPQAPNLNAEGDLKVASFNVLNYFTTLDERGADSEEEFTRQKAKIVAALAAMDADVVGLMEIENNGFGEQSALADLVTALNQADPGFEWQYVTPEAEQIGTDAIMVALIYRSSVVSPVNAAGILDSSNSSTDADGNALFLDTKNRPTLAQEFNHTDTDQSFVVAVNHLKSKGSDCDDVNDPDTGDGQGNCNLTRTRAAEAIATWLNSEYTDKPIVVIGDLNAYAQEDPLTTLSDNGFTELFSHLEKTDAYSYVFSGESGQLDHALANDSMLASVVDVTEWHINTDEPISLDYNMEFKSDEQITSYYSADPFRSSDHDPVVIAIQLETSDSDMGPPPVEEEENNSSGGGSLSAYLVMLMGSLSIFRRLRRRNNA